MHEPCVGLQYFHLRPRARASMYTRPVTGPWDKIVSTDLKNWKADLEKLENRSWINVWSWALFPTLHQTYCKYTCGVGQRDWIWALVCYIIWLDQLISWPPGLEPACLRGLLQDPETKSCRLTWKIGKQLEKLENRSGILLWSWVLFPTLHQTYWKYICRLNMYHIFICLLCLRDFMNLCAYSSLLSRMVP